MLVVVEVAVGPLEDRLELRPVHLQDDQRVLVRHGREHVADLELVRVGRRGPVRDAPVGHGAGQVDVDRDALALQLPDRGIGLEVGAVGLLGEGQVGVDRHGGLADHRVVVGGDEVLVRLHQGHGRGILDRGDRDRDVAPGAGHDLVAAARLGQQAQRDLAQVRVVAVRLGDDHRLVVGVGHERRQELVVAVPGDRVGVAVAADDGVHVRHLGGEVGVDVVVDLDAAGNGREPDVGQRDDDVV